MLSFENDYAEGAHPLILQRLLETNRVQQPGYGEDAYCQSAKEKIRIACGSPEMEIFFLTGGTQTNQVVIDGMLRGVEGVVSAVSGHVNCHEAGAIEYTGHKVITLPEYQGKIKAEDLSILLRDFYCDPAHAHMVYPGMVYISHPTEWGTLYTRKELAALHDVCQHAHIPLFVDGARLGYGLMSDETDVTLKDLCQYADVFSIGGTKVGALCGEAVVFQPGAVPAYFLTHIKQHGAMLAKGRLLGIQFDALFSDELYFRISRHAIDMAKKLKQGFQERGFRFYLDSPTNQQFIILQDEEMSVIGRQAVFSFWMKTKENENVVRFATSWATTEEQIQELMSILDQVHSA